MASAVIRTCHNVFRFPLISRLSAVTQIISSKSISLSSSNNAPLQIPMPSLSPTMETGTIVKWYKKEGDSISAGDVLCDIQTDKAVVGMDTEEEGILAKILAPENSQNVKVGRIIALIAEEGEDWKSIDVPADAELAIDTTADVPASQVTSISDPSGRGSDHHSSAVGPSVRKLMEEYGLKATDISPSGPHDRLLKGDVLNHIKSKNLSKVILDAEPITEAQVMPSPLPTAGSPTIPVLPRPTAIPMEGEEFVDIPNTSMRKIIAQRLTESKTTIPHSYATIDCNVGSATTLRKRLARQGIKVSMNDFIIKASGLSLQRVPRVNTVYQGAAPQQSSSVDISVAVATDKGLITPIVKNAPLLEVEDISLKVKDLAGRARDGKLRPEEYQGGTFSISNLGMFGISEFSAVINPPQAAILAIGSSRLVVDNDGEPCTKMTVTLSYDSRVIDEVEASHFLEAFRDFMENPNLLVSKSSQSTEREAYAF